MIRDDTRTNQIFAAIERAIARDGRPPTMRDIQDALGISSSSVVSYHLDKLERYVRITRRRSISRGIEIVRPSAGVIVRPYTGGPDRDAVLLDWCARLEEELFAVLQAIDIGRQDQYDMLD